MDKILVSLKTSFIPEDETGYFKTGLGSFDLCGYNDPLAKRAAPDIKRCYHHNKEVTTQISLNKGKLKDGLYESELEYWLDHGYFIDREYSDHTILRKETHYCMTKETLDIVNDLFIEDKQKYESKIYDLEREKREIGQSFDELVGMIDTSGFFKRLKYLFTGRIK